jgi:hypothetical protein
MPSSLRFRIVTIAVFATGIVTALAAAGASAWSWMTPGTHPFFAIALPLATAWLIAAMVRLVLELRRAASEGAEDWRDPLTALLSSPRHAPDAAIRASWPDAQFCQRIALPPDPATPWWLRPWRRRIALHIGLPEGRHRLVVAPASLLAGRGRPREPLHAGA